MEGSQGSPLLDLDWICLYDYINISSKVDIYKRINNFFESFYPLKYKSSGRDKVKFKPFQREGLLGYVALAISKILYSYELFLASELEICADEDKAMKDIIKISQIFIEIEIHYLEDSIRVESLMNIVNEIAWEMTKTAKETKIFLENKVMAVLFRLFEFFEWFWESYTGDIEAIEIMFKLLHRIIFNVHQKFIKEIGLFKEISQIVTKLLTFFETKKIVKEKKFSQEFDSSLNAICSKQKRLMTLLVEPSMIKALGHLGETVPKDLVDNYLAAEIEINNLIAQEEQLIEPIILAERIRNTDGWKKKITQQLINLTVEKLITNPSKILLMQDFKKSNGFPLFNI